MAKLSLKSERGTLVKTRNPKEPLLQLLLKPINFTKGPWSGKWVTREGPKE